MTSKFDEAEYMDLLQKQLDALQALEGQTLQGFVEVGTLSQMPMVARPLAEAYLALYDAANLALHATSELSGYITSLVPHDGLVVITNGDQLSIEVQDG